MIPKFRVWNKKTESFIDYGDLMLDLKNGKVYAGDVGMPEYTIDVTKQVVLIQSTGLKDKNGKEIYNHQKVLVDSPKGAFEAKVVFEHGGFGIVATKGRVCDYFEASWIDDFVPFIDLYVIESCEEDTLWMVEVAEE